MRSSAVLAFVFASALSAQTAPVPSAVVPEPGPSVGMPLPPKPAISIDNSQDLHAWLPLWPGGAPGAQGKAEADIPAVSVYLPAANPTHTVIVVAPGGGYQHLALDHEGLQVAQWLNAHGVAAVVLRYRLGPTYHHPIELGDAQRAIRFARAHAPAWGVQPDHVGMWGFSAGGHLTATAGTHYDGGNPSAEDHMERVSSKPDFLILAYPVISFDPAIQHAGSRKYLLGDSPDPSLVTSLSNEQQVNAQTPPTFLFHTSDDPVVPVANSIVFYQALVKNKVPAELHIFRHGPHGVGLAQANPELSGWPDLLYHWLHENGWAQ